MPVEKNEGTCTAEPILDPEKQARTRSDFYNTNDEHLERHAVAVEENLMYLRSELARRRAAAEQSKKLAAEEAEAKRAAALALLGLAEDDVKCIGEIKKLTEDLKKSIDTFRVQPDAWRPFEPFHPNPSYPFFPALDYWSK